MPTQMSVQDEVRLNILDAILRSGAVSPNIKQIQKNTGYHKATIKASIDFFKKEGILKGYGPKIDYHSFGYGLEVLEFLQIDFSKKDILEKFLDKVRQDPNIHLLTSLIGAGNWNMMARHFYKNVESYHRETMKNYYSMEGIHELIKDRVAYYTTNPIYKNSSRTSSIIKIIKRDAGLD